MFDDDESELSDNISLTSSMDIDIDPFASNTNTAHPKPDAGVDGFSIQYLLPLEIVELIAIRIADDADLMNFALTCKDFATATVLEKSTVWRTRFLARYDHPIIEGPYEFRVAYQLRELVLRKFPSFASRCTARSRAALEVLRDMVLETYHSPRGRKGTRSRNLEVLSSPMSAPYMEEFLSSPFFAYNDLPYGKPNGLFAALQLVFSHLVLHPSSDFAVETKASRDNYDLKIIYLYALPLRTIYYARESQIQDTEPQKRNLKLDLDALLHIRNFWNSHLAYNTTGLYTNPVTTYGEMARMLVRRNHAPRAWDRAIQESVEVQAHWYGHYSCTHPTPRYLTDIEEHQTCAEDWILQYGKNGVHPLTLDLQATNSPQRGWWPPIFATIPILESTTPHADADNGHVYIRGIAPLLSPTTHPDMYPAYKSLRVRGVIHPLPAQKEIPGWRRIVMVMYQPTPRYLLAVLDVNSPEDDDPFDQIEPTAALQVPNVNQEGVAEQSTAFDQMQTQDQGQAQPQAQNPAQMVTADAVPANSEEAEKAMREDLEAREELKGPLGPAYLTRDFIAEMEDNLHQPEELAWEDIGYAYVYEGVIIPGGKIMMGRHWWCGPPTVVDGFELGNGVDRGPWVFWC